MANLTSAQASTMLKALGFRITKGSTYSTAVRGFQAGWNNGTALKVDGLMGPATSTALRKADTLRKGGKPTASKSFGYKEFQCKCGGKYSACRGVLVQRKLLAALEKYRAKYGSTTIVSGYRCKGHNSAVDGATQSQHLTGTAADIPYKATASQVKSLGVFTGIGKSRSTQKVRHVDVRTGKSGTPTVWNYAS